MRRLRWTVTAALFLFATGCVVNKDYVRADQATFDAIAPEYKEYVQNDPKLDAAQKMRRLRTVETWKLRIEEAAK